MNPLLLLAIAGGGLIALGTAFSRQVRIEVVRAREELLDVAPDCSSIRLRGVGENVSAAELDAMLDKARKFYFTPKIAEARRFFPPKGMPNLTAYSRAVTAFVMRDLIPQCDWGTVPSGPSDPRFWIWATLGNWIRIESLEGVECDPLEEAPAGTICVPAGKKHVLTRQG